MAAILWALSCTSREVGWLDDRFVLEKRGLMRRISGTGGNSERLLASTEYLRWNNFGLTGNGFAPLTQRRWFIQKMNLNGVSTVAYTSPRTCI
jgi:hypothetical protein